MASLTLPNDLASLARVSERCPGLLEHIGHCVSSEPVAEELIVLSARDSWRPADILAAVTLLTSVGALESVHGAATPSGQVLRATPLLADTIARAVSIADVLPALRAQSEEEVKVTLVVSWPSTIPLPLFSEWRSSKLALIELIDDACCAATLVFPFIDAAGVEEISLSLLRALNRGVRVVLLTRHLSDPESANARFAEVLRRNSHGHFTALNLASDGSHARELLHAKVLVIDEGRRGYIGSANLTSSAFGQSLEIGVVLEGAAARSISELISELIPRSRLA